MLALTGGGQRPQAYVRLQCPKEAELRELSTRFLRGNDGDKDDRDDDADDENSNQCTYESGSFIKNAVVCIKTFREKTARALDIPHVTFPALVGPFIQFHVRYARPVMLRRRQRREQQLVALNKGGFGESHFRKDAPLCVHSRHGDYLTTHNMSNAI